jgi:OmpA-OmpF porin, OOP family
MGEQVMGNRLLASCVATAALAVGSISGASAAEEGFYFGITGGQSSADTDLAADSADVIAIGASLRGAVVSRIRSESDETDGAWGLHVGYQWNSYVSTEVGYVELGEAFDDFVATLTTPPPAAAPAGAIGLSYKLRTSGITAAMLGTLPLGEKFDLHARGGILFARTRGTVLGRNAVTNTVEGSFHSRGNSKDFFAGVGGAWNINPDYTLRVDYQRFLDVGDDEDVPEYDIDLISVSILFR